jgi:hypothetical protein
MRTLGYLGGMKRSIVMHSRCKFYSLISWVWICTFATKLWKMLSIPTVGGTVTDILLSYANDRGWWNCGSVLQVVRKMVLLKCGCSLAMWSRKVEVFLSYLLRPGIPVPTNGANDSGGSKKLVGLDNRETLCRLGGGVSIYKYFDTQVSVRIIESKEVFE